MFIERKVQDLLKQIARDKELYKGYPIVLVFASTNPNGTTTVIPPAVLQQLNAEGATVMTSPPDKVLGVGAQDLPHASTSPQQLSNSAARLSGKIASTAEIAGQVAGSIGGPDSNNQLPQLDDGNTVEGSVTYPDK